MSFTSIPYEWIKSLRVIPVSGDVRKMSFELNRVYPFLYKSKDIFNKGNVVYINQSFDRAWLLFCGFTLCDAKHTTMNGWSNVWVLNSTYKGTVYTIYTPQTLLFLGLIIEVGILSILLHIRNSKQSYKGAVLD